MLPESRTRRASSSPIALVLPETGVAHAVGAARARAASPARVEELTGFPAGGVAPFLPGRVDRVLIDHRLLIHDRVWVGAGSTRHVAGLPPAELLRLTRGEQLAIAADPEASD